MNSYQKLIEDNHNLIYAYLKKHNLSEDEYYDVLAIALCKAAKKYDPKKSSFSTLAYRCFDNAVRFEWRKRASRIPKNLIYSVEEDSKSFGDLKTKNQISEFEENDVIRHFRTKLSPKTQKVYDLLLQDYRVSDIAKIFNCSNQNISMYKKHIQEQWKCYKKMNDLGGFFNERF